MAVKLTDNMESVLQEAFFVNSSTLETLDKITFLKDKIERLLKEKEKIKMEKFPISDSLLQHDKLLQILKWIHGIQNLESHLESLEVSKPCWDSKMSMYKSFKIIAEMENRLSESKCINLAKYIRQVSGFWKMRLSYLFSSELNELLTSKFNWPSVILTETQPQLSSDVIEQFQIIINILEYMKGEPMSILAAPLLKRFKYHFMSTAKTNCTHKPEWCLQQTLLWIKNSQQLLSSLLTSFSFSTFVEHLLQILKKKIEKDLSHILEDDLLFSHYIDEILIFTRELSEFKCARHEFFPINVLSEIEVFSKWIDLERKFAYEKLDGIFLDEAALTESSVYNKVSKSSIRFLALLTRMSDRYKILTQIHLKKKFVSLQNELIEDLRLRFVQMLRIESSCPVNFKSILITNSAHHISSEICKWSELPMFIKLEFELDERGLFEQGVQRLNFVVTESLKALAEYIFQDGIRQGKAYYFDKDWNHLISEDLSSEALPFLQILSSHLFFINQNLLGDLSSQTTQQLLSHLRDFIVNELIGKNNFSSRGCLQLKSDIINGFLPLFSQINVEEKTLFDEFIELTKLLELSTGNAVLLKESLLNEKNGKASKILKEFNLTIIKKELVISILNQRNII